MSAVVVAAFTAGLTGSLHCVAMCGPLVGLASTNRLGPSARLALVHGFGRLATYLAIGAVAGLVGGALDLAGRLASIQRVAALIGRTWERRPMIREAIVTRLWPLSLQGGPREAPPLPCHHPDAMGQGVLRDGLGRRHRVPRARLLLNAAVVAIATEETP